MTNEMHNIICSYCKKSIDVELENKSTCPHCNNYLSMSPEKRILQLSDEGSFKEWKLVKKINLNPICFPGYFEKIQNLQKALGVEEGILIGEAKIDKQKVAIGVMDIRFMMGSMGVYMGEAITEAFERAAERRMPVIIICCSGGARMQEGVLSLMQMAKISATIKKISSKVLYISILTHPTLGGVTASFGMLGDIILAEPNATIGFTGRRVIKETIRESLPLDFQTSEFQLKHGFVDAIVPRDEMKNYLITLLRLHKHKKEYRKIEKMRGEKIYETFSKFTAWERVTISRNRFRPPSSVYINYLMHDFVELSGDRCGGNDSSIIGGIAMFHEIPVTVLGIERSKNSIEEAIQCNFGMPKPGGYKKALRLMKQAEKFGRPIICFIDTPGAYPGYEAEVEGQALAIARNMFEMSAIRVPILSIIIGEGYSGGALGLAVADEIWMLSNSVFSVASPESFMSILQNEKMDNEKACILMQLTAEDLKRQGVIDHIICEKNPICIDNIKNVCYILDEEIYKFLFKYRKISKEKLIKQRYAKYRRF